MGWLKGNVKFGLFFIWSTEYVEETDFRQLIISVK